MSKGLSIAVLVLAIVATIVVAAVRPTWLGDENAFLQDFVNHELLNILGVILAITLASLGQMHLKLNDIEEKILERTGEGLDGPEMQNMRAELKSSAKWLIGLFASALVLVVVKPLIISCGVSASFVNGAALWIVLFNILVLADVTFSVFRIEGD